MTRKRSHHSRRSSASTERSYHEYLMSVPAPTTSRAELVRLIRGGEDTYLELKVKFSNVEKITAEIIALANTEGGAIVFGVNDQLRIEGVDDPEAVESDLREICARQILPPVFPYLRKVAFDNGRRIVVLEIDAHHRPHHTLDYQFYVREGSSKRETTREELSVLYGEAPLRRFEDVPAHKARIADIDESLFWSFVRGVNPTEWERDDKGFPTAQLMSDFGLAMRERDEILPTLGGLLLFGQHQKVIALMPQASIQLIRYGGTSNAAPTVETVCLQGNLLRLFEGTLNFLRRYVDLWDVRPSRKAMTEEERLLSRAHYSQQAVLEAVTNFILHRDWSVTTKSARLEIYDDRIELANPAAPPGLPLNALRYGISQPANPRIKAIFTNRHYGVTLPQGGIPMVFEAATAFAKRAPEGFSLQSGEFRVRLFGWR